VLNQMKPTQLDWMNLQNRDEWGGSVARRAYRERSYVNVITKCASLEERGESDNLAK
jgi:hypothetical protein